MATIDFDSIEELYKSNELNQEQKSVLDSSDIEKQFKKLMKSADAESKANAIEIAKRSHNEALQAKNTFKKLEDEAQKLGLKIGYEFNKSTNTFEVKFYDTQKLDNNGKASRLNNKTRIKLSLESGHSVVSGGRVASETYAPSQSKEGVYLTNSLTRTANELIKGLNELSKARSGKEGTFDRRLRKTLEEAESMKIAEGFNSNYTDEEYKKSRNNISGAAHERQLGTIDMNLLNKQIAEQTKMYKEQVAELNKKHMNTIENRQKALDNAMKTVNIIQEAQRNFEEKQAKQIAADYKVQEEDYNLILNNLGEIGKIKSNIGELNERALVKGKTTFGTSTNSLSILPNPARDNKHAKQVENGLKKIKNYGPSYKLRQNGSGDEKYSNYSISKTLQATPKELEAAYKEVIKDDIDRLYQVNVA